MKNGLLIGNYLIDLPDDTFRVYFSEMLSGKFTFMTKHVLIVANPDLVEFFSIVRIDS